MTRELSARELRGQGPCPHEDDAASYVLGNMPHEHERAFLAHLDTGCAPCREAVDEASESVAWVDLAEGIEEPRDDERPPEALRERVLEAVAPSADTELQVWRGWERAAPTGGLQTVSASEGGWEPISIEGIHVKRLTSDEKNVTMLVRMGPGTAYPRHRHAGQEQCYVLQGDLSVGDDLHLGAGDFQVAPEGSVHDVQSTREGCLLLIVSSQSDELVD